MGRRQRQRDKDDELVKTVKKLRGPTRRRKAGPIPNIKDEEREGTGRRKDDWRNWEEIS